MLIVRLMIKKAVSVSVITVATIIFMIVPTIAGAGIDQWTSNGPEGGEITAIGFSPNYILDQTVFTGTRYGGIFRSIDGGQSWSLVNNNLSTEVVKDIVVSPNFTIDQTLFALISGVSDSELYRSTDGGITWMKLDLDVPNANIQSIALSPFFDIDRTVFASGNAFYVSNDGGGAWTKNTGGPAYANSLAPSPNYALDNTLFAAKWEGLYKSVDGGLNWALETASPNYMLRIAVSPGFALDETLFALTYEGRVFKSSDGGSTWNDTGLASGGYGYDMYMSISSNYAADSTLFVGRGVWLSKTTDGGATWSGTWPPAGPVVAVAPSYAVDGTVFSGSWLGWNNGLAKSTDGGMTWALNNSGLVNTVVSRLAISPNFASDKTIFSIARRPDGRTPIFKSSDRGLNWTQLPLDFTGLRGVVISDSYALDNTIFLYHDGRILKSTDGGLTWSDASDYTPGISQLVLSPNYLVDQTALYVRNGYIYKTTDGAAAWDLIIPGDWEASSGNWVAFSPNYETDNKIFKGDSSGFYQSTNGGSGWVRLNEMVLGMPIFSPNFAGDNTMFALNSGNDLYKSTDSGVTWTFIASNLTNGLNLSLAVSPNYSSDNTLFAWLPGYGYFTGPNAINGFYMSTNGGRSWIKKNAGLYNANIQSFVVSPNYALDKTVFAGTFGSGVFSNSLIKPTTVMMTEPMYPNGKNNWFVTETVITLSADRPGNTYYRFSEDATNTYSGPISAPEGQRTIYYFSADNEGNIETVNSQLIKVDRQSPVPPVIGSPSHIASARSEDPTVDIKIIDATDLASGLNGYSTLWDANPDTTPDETIELQADVVSTSSPSLADGYWYFHVRTEDKAGNWSPAAHLGPFMIDTGPPTTLLTAQPIDPDGNNSWFKSSPTIGLSADKPGVTYFSLNGEATQTYADSFQVSEGENTITFFSVSSVGNTETVKSKLIKVDTGNPVDPGLSSPSHTVGGSSDDNTIDIDLANAVDGVSGVDGYSVEWTKNATTTPDDIKDVEETSSSLTSQALTPGSWYVNFRTVDNAGNWTSTAHLGPFNILGNLVTNPGFETGDFTGWSVSTTWTVTSTDAHSGSYSAVFSPGTAGFHEESGYNGGLRRLYTALGGGKWYTLSAWLKQVDTVDDTNPANPTYSPNRLVSAFRSGGGSLNYVGGSNRVVVLDPPVLANETGWVLRSRTFFVPENADYNIVFRFVGKALSADSRILVDDLSIIEETSPPATAAPGAIDTWVLQNGNNQTQEIVDDNKGNLWVGLGNGGGIIKWNKKLGSTVATYPAGSPYDASTLKRSSSGDIMYASWDGDKLGVLDPDTGTLDETATTLNSEPVGPSEDSAGNFWFAEHLGGNLAKWDRSAGTITRFSLPVAGAEPGYLIKGQQTKLWFTNQLGGGLGYYDTDANTFGPVYSVGAANSWPAVIVQDDAGDILIPLRFENKVVKFNPLMETTTRAYTLPTPFSGPQGIDIDRLGNLWVAQSWAGTIAKIDPVSGAVTEFRKSEPGETTKFLHTDKNGNVWFGSRYGGNPAMTLLNKLKNTQPGAGVKVGLFDQDAEGTDILSIFANVTSPGETSATTQSPPGSAPVNMQLKGDTWNVRTSAVYSGNTTVGIAYDEAALGGDEANAKLLRWAGGGWQNITTFVDTAKNMVYGQSNSLSPFSVALFADSTPPTKPVLAGFALSATEISLFWGAATDNVGVAGYKIFDAGTDSEIGVTPSTSYLCAGLSPGSFYEYYVKAYDGVGNHSAASNTIRLRPAGGTDTPDDSQPATVTVQPQTNVSLTFSDVTVGGQTNVTVTSDPTMTAPSGFNFLGNQYDITTTASFVGPINISLRYDDPGISNEAGLKLFHFENGAWQDVTVSVDTVNNVITGQVNSLSPFIVGGPVPPATGVNHVVVAALAFLILGAGALAMRRRDLVVS